MKILWYTDTHFGLSGAFSRPSSSGYTSRLDETLELHSWVADLVKEHQPDLTIHGGDIYKPQIVLHGVEVSASTRGTSKVVRASKMHLTLLGNHDYITKDTKVTAIDWLDEKEGSKVIKMVDFMEVPDEDVLLVFCPYVWDYSHVVRKMEEELSRDYKDIYFFGHAEIGGALNSMVMDLGSGETHKHYSENSNSVPVDLLSQFTMAFNGHHHIPQKPAENVYLTGSLQQFTVTEYSPDMPRGVYILDTETKELEFIENKITPEIVRVENNLEKLGPLPDNTYVIYYYNPKDIEKEDLIPHLQRFKDYKAKPIGTEKFKPISSVDFESKEEDYAGMYKEYLETVAFDSKEMEKEVRERGLKTVKKAEDTE